MTTGFLRYLTMLTPSASRDSTVIRTGRAARCTGYPRGFLSFSEHGDFGADALRFPERNYSRLDDTLMNRAQVFRQPGGCSSSVTRSIHRGKPRPQPGDAPLNPRPLNFVAGRVR